jgi:hypothetical protein
MYRACQQLPRVWELKLTVFQVKLARDVKILEDALDEFLT